MNNQQNHDLKYADIIIPESSVFKYQQGNDFMFSEVKIYNKTSKEFRSSELHIVDLPMICQLSFVGKNIDFYNPDSFLLPIITAFEKTTKTQLFFGVKEMKNENTFKDERIFTFLMERDIGYTFVNWLRYHEINKLNHCNEKVKFNLVSTTDKYLYEEYIKNNIKNGMNIVRYQNIYSIDDTRMPIIIVVSCDELFNISDSYFDFESCKYNDEDQHRDKRRKI